MKPLTFCEPISFRTLVYSVVCVNYSRRVPSNSYHSFIRCHWDGAGKQPIFDCNCSVKIFTYRKHSIAVPSQVSACFEVFTLIPLLQEKSRACQSDFQMEGASLIIHVYKQTKLGSPEAALTWPKWGTIILEFRVEEESQVRITYFNWKVIRQEHQQTAVEIEKP